MLLTLSKKSSMSVLFVAKSFIGMKILDGLEATKYMALATLRGKRKESRPRLAVLSVRRQ